MDSVTVRWCTATSTRDVDSYEAPGYHSCIYTAEHEVPHRCACGYSWPEEEKPA